MHHPPSPCVSVCRLDRATGWCLGCRRTLEEIADWPILSSSEKHAVIARMEQRPAAAG
jgi:uncharacterized protein